jgi:outer membrane protein
MPVLITLSRLFLAACCMFFIKASQGQDITLSLKDVLQRVEKNLPQLEAYRQQALAEKENSRLAKISLMPEMNAGYQANMATFNNITGMSYPGFLLPISGPPSAGNDLNFIPGSALGMLVKWNPFTFGQRNAAIEKAAAQFKEANAVYNEQLFRYQYSALNTYLEVVYLQQVMKAIQAGMARNKIGLEQSLVLAAAGLKPGIDTTQFQSAIIQGEMELLQTEKTWLQKLTELGMLTGILQNAAVSIILTDTIFNTQLPVMADTVNFNGHPLYQTLLARQKKREAELKEIRRSWVPQLDIWGNLYTRGSGINASGQIDKADGFRFSRTNAGLGFQLSFPLLQYTKVNIRLKQQSLLLKAAEADREQAALTITQQATSAFLQYNQDRSISEKAPRLWKAAQDVYEGLRISYEAGLIDYTRLSQAQYDLVKAELTNASAQLQLWRSLLAISVARGNLDIFLSQLPK